MNGYKNINNFSSLLFLLGSPYKNNKIALLHCWRLDWPFILCVFCHSFDPVSLFLCMFGHRFVDVCGCFTAQLEQTNKPTNSSEYFKTIAKVLFHFISFHFIICFLCLSRSEKYLSLLLLLLLLLIVYFAQNSIAHFSTYEREFDTSFSKETDQEN